MHAHPQLVRSLVVAFLLAGCGSTGPSRATPEGASGWRQVRAVEAREYMAVAANPHATRAGADILAAGGSAVDAAIAMQLVLTLVEPQSSGIGGGAFLLHYDPLDRRIRTWDGRESAPSAATPTMFHLDGTPNSKPMSWPQAVRTGLSVGTPGVIRMLAAVHREYGKLAWFELFQPAIRLAEEGFEVSPRLHELLGSERWSFGLRELRAAAAYFFDAEGQAHPVGHRLNNPALATTLRLLAADSEALYRGPIAAQIVAAVRGAKPPGHLSLADLAAYKPKERAPVCLELRAWLVCGMGPPTSGGVTTLQILGILERLARPQPPRGSLPAVHLLIEASRLAFADRARYLADPDFVDVPTQALLSGAYLAERAALVRPTEALKEVSPGRVSARLPPPDRSPELPSTSHLVAVDRDGRAVSMTASVEMAFGSGLMAGGFLLNNQLTDFSFEPGPPQAPVANRIQAGKRPRSSMAPFIVVDKADGSLELLLGSPGGSRIIGYVARVMADVLLWGQPLQDSIAAPHVLSRGGTVDVEDRQAGLPASVLAGLRALGHDVKASALTSGIHAIQRRDDGSYLGAVDPRREGVAIGR